MAISYRTQDVGPPSPALTNPDMILPFTPSKTFRGASQSPSRPAIPRSIGPDMAVASQASNWTPPLSGKSSRPSMPGAWQTEEDLSNTLTRTQPQQNGLSAGWTSAPLKSPASRFLNTLGPKLRAGLGVEAPEYSPSVYSPTESELAQRSPYQEEELEPEQDQLTTPVDERIDEPEDAEHEKQIKSFLVEEDEDPYEDTSLSLRAEEILANAKKRLTEMENNLNRARSLSVGRSVSVNETAEVNAMGEDWALSAAKLRGNKTLNTGNLNHGRVFSDPSVSGPNPRQALPGSAPANVDNIRSASAMSSIGGGGFGASDSPFTYQLRHLEPLHEDDLLQSPVDRPGSALMGSRTSFRAKPQLSDLQAQMQDLKGKIDSLKQKAKEDSLRRRSVQALRVSSPFTNADLSNTSSSFPHRNHNSRSRSSKEHSPDRSDEFLGEDHVRAIADFDKQDEPNPVSAASPQQLVHINTKDTKADDADAATVDTYFDTRSASLSHGSSNNGNREIPQIKSIKSSQSHLEPVGGSNLHPTTAGSEDDHFSPHSQRVEFGDVNDLSTQPSPASQTYDLSYQPSPASPTYEYDTDFLSPDLPPPAMPTPHEQRPDAFDYETYVLNSTMGSFSRQGHHPHLHTHSRSSSTSSARTVSTTKPTNNSFARQESYPQQHPSIFAPPDHSPDTSFDPNVAFRPRHERQDSVSSDSTTATFATCASATSNNVARGGMHRMRSDRDLRAAMTADGFLSPILPTNGSSAHLPLPTTNITTPQDQIPTNSTTAQTRGNPTLSLAPPAHPHLLPNNSAHSPKRNSFSPSSASAAIPSPTFSTHSASSATTATLPLTNTHKHSRSHSHSHSYPKDLSPLSPLSPFPPLGPPTPLTSLPPAEAKSRILALLLAGSYGAEVDGGKMGLFWAPEDEVLVGRVVEGLLRVCGRVVGGERFGDGREGEMEGGGESNGHANRNGDGEREKEDARGLLESVGAVLGR